MHDKADKTRRDFLRRMAALGATAPVAGFAISAAGPAAAQERAEDGHALDYVNDATGGVDHPRYRDGSVCSGCTFWQGGDAEWGACQHPQFRDIEVNANGWCSAWVRGRA
jgi:anaerobic selenocysteine-containing dehydrogenase